MNDNIYVKQSLELHLFFDRIMKEHSFFLEASFMEKNQELKKLANQFQKTFSDILERVISISDGNISQGLLNSNEIVTSNTLEAENKTSKLSGIAINTNLTIREMGLRSGPYPITEQIKVSISNLNRYTLTMVNQLIQFKNDVLNQVLSCNLYTTNYPLLIQHIMNEAKVYYQLLNKVENRENLTTNYLYEQELFWDDIMKEHAEFIRGSLDPSEKELILTADKFNNQYDLLIKTYGNNSSFLTNESLKLTTDFRNFKIAGEKGILNCQIKSIIIPLLADHVVREANHFIRILRNFNNNEEKSAY